MIPILRLYLRHLLTFDAPELRCLVVSDLIIEGKSYLYVYWKIRNGFKVRIKRFKTIYRSETTVVLKIPGHLTEIELVYSNAWRKKRQKLFLSKVAMEDKVLDNCMTDDFRKQRKTAITGVKISSLTSGEYKQVNESPKLKNLNTSVKQTRLTLKNHRYE